MHCGFYTLTTWLVLYFNDYTVLDVILTPSEIIPIQFYFVSLASNTILLMEVLSRYYCILSSTPELLYLPISLSSSSLQNVPFVETLLLPRTLLI